MDDPPSPHTLSNLGGVELFTLILPINFEPSMIRVAGTVIVESQLYRILEHWKLTTQSAHRVSPHLWLLMCLVVYVVRIGNSIRTSIGKIAVPSRDAFINTGASVNGR